MFFSFKKYNYLQPFTNILWVTAFRVNEYFMLCLIFPHQIMYECWLFALEHGFLHVVVLLKDSIICLTLPGIGTKGLK